MFSSLQRLAGQGITAEQFVALDHLRRSIDPSSAPTGVALAELEESLTDWLGDHAVDRDWVIAPVLAGAGADLLAGRAAAALPPAPVAAWSGWPARCRPRDPHPEVKHATGASPTSWPR